MTKPRKTDGVVRKQLQYVLSRRTDEERNESTADVGTLETPNAT
jgi:hypothetical protein